jgi:hypothetical protein
MATELAAPEAGLRMSAEGSHLVRLSSGARMRVTGAYDACDRYLESLLIWSRKEDQAPLSTSDTLLDVKLDNRVEPDSDAIVCRDGLWVGAAGAVWIPTTHGYLEIRRLGEQHWQITRSDFEQLDVDRALAKSIGLSHGVLPLHASIANLRGHGIATIGRAESGKTSVLLTLLAQGASWLTDDDADAQLATGDVQACPCPVSAKWRYLRELPTLRREASLTNRLRMRSHGVLRAAARQLRHLPFPGTISRKLKRVAKGESRLQIEFPNRIAKTRLKTVVFVIPGVQSEIRVSSLEEVCNSVAAVLSSELEPIFALDKFMRGNGIPPLLDSGCDPLQTVRGLTRRFLKNKHVFVLTRAPRTSMQQMAHLLEAVTELADDAPSLA